MVLVSACLTGATEIAGVDNVARAKKQGLKTREWTRRHEETRVDNAGVSDRENNVLVALSLHRKSNMFKLQIYFCYFRQIITTACQSLKTV